jgi:biotin carboxylase
MFGKLLIANRGEIAVRIIRADTRRIPASSALAAPQRTTAYASARLGPASLICSGLGPEALGVKR